MSAVQIMTVLADERGKRFVIASQLARSSAAESAAKALAFGHATVAMVVEY